LISPQTRPLVYLITDGSVSDNTFDTCRARILETIHFAVAEGVPLIQIREKNLSIQLLTALVADAACLTRGSSTRLFVNDRADVAVAAGADGVHLATTSLPVKAIRESFPADLLIGVSTHDLDEVQKAADEGADFAVFGPVFETPGKGPACGSELLHYVCKAVSPFPVLALGGVNEQNWKSVIDAGAAGFAAIRSLNDPASLRKIMQAIRDER
jgi:thiamine-phosphate pyrophosphorylase